MLDLNYPDTVLIVDDSPSVRAALKLIIKQKFGTIIEAADGSLALQLLKEQSPPLSVALVDWWMPQMNGPELIAEMRKLPAYQSVPILVITSATDMEIVSQALSLGANEFLMKPFTSDMVWEKLELLGLYP